MLETNTANPLPQYMEKGSHGPFCVAVNAFLVGVAAVWSSVSDPEFVADVVYGEKAVVLMKDYQSDSGLKVDGGCGPETRAEMKSDGFDSDVVANCLHGVTVFVQPDGSEISWSPVVAEIAADAPIPPAKPAI